jgi:hypothetical protein
VPRRTPLAAVRAATWPRAVAAVLVVALAGGLIARQLETAPGTEPGPTPTPTPTTTPSATAATLPTGVAWAEAALRAPYPIPLRPEPAGGAPVAAADELEVGSGERSRFRWVDAAGDVRDQADPRVDLVTIEFGRGACLSISALCVWYWPAQGLERPLPDPASEWIAYGMVIDNDRDGVADGRYGIDNIPSDSLRAWQVDDRPGRRPEYKLSTPVSPTIDGAYGESEAPTVNAGTHSGRGYMWLRGSVVTVEGEKGGGFYLWAAVIRDGRMVSIDYAPDSGWLVAPREIVP